MALLSALTSVTGIGSSLSSIGSSLGFGPGVTLAAVYREDGARWSAAKQYWEKPSGTKAAVQSPKPSGCAPGVACIQSMSGGPVTVGGVPIVTPKGTTVQQVASMLPASGGGSVSPASYPLGIGNSGSQTNTPVLVGGVTQSGGALGEKTTGYVIVGAIILAALMLVRK